VGPAAAAPATPEVTRGCPRGEFLLALPEEPAKLLVANHLQRARHRPGARREPEEV
jgi:hypothetical protein